MNASRQRKPLVRAPCQARNAFERIHADTLVGMAFSNLIAIAIVVTTAATLNKAGVTNVETSAQAAEALKPVAGEFAFVLFALGIVGTGLLAIPVLAGSAAYAIGEACKWPIGLSRQPSQAAGFYATLTAAAVLGVAITLSPINPIKALYWTAVPAPAGSRRRSAVPELEVQDAHEQGEAHSIRDDDDVIVFQKAVDDP